MELASEIPASILSSRLFPEVNVEPLGDLILNYLIDWDNEEPYLDFKNIISVSANSDFAKIAKDIFAFSNYGGGYILVGFKQRTQKLAPNMRNIERRQFIPIGLPDDFAIEPANLQTKFDAYASEPVTIGCREFTREIEGESKRFAAINVPASLTVLKPIKAGYYLDGKGKLKRAFSIGEVLFRRGTESRTATDEEKAWIERRVKKTEHRLSILSGEPDEVSEQLYLNLFPVTKLPDYVWTAELRPPEERYMEDKHYDYRPCFVWWHSSRIVTFEDPNSENSPLRNMVRAASVSRESFAQWFTDDDKRRTLTHLLNKELIYCGKRVGLQHNRDRRKFYFECFGQSRVQEWKPRFRSSSSLTVAQSLWVNQLGRTIYWHVAVIARFVVIDDRFFLRLSPTIILTEDGRQAIFGTKEGAVITRLTYNKYNASYLNSLLFWISIFNTNEAGLLLAQGKVVISDKPVESRLGTGILADRPVAEPMQETPDIEIGDR